MKIKIYLIFSLFLNINVAVRAQYSCESVMVISDLPYTDQGITSSSTASYEASNFCDDNTGYEEFSYILKYIPIVDQNISIRVNFVENDIDKTGIYVFNDCDDNPEECVIFSENTVEGEILLNFIAKEVEEYYIFVGSENPSQLFTVEILKEEVVGLSINKAEPTQALDVKGSIRIGEGETTPYEGTVRWKKPEKELQAYDGFVWKSLRVDLLNDMRDVYAENSSLILPVAESIDNYGGANNISIGTGSGQAANGFSNTALGVRAAAFLDDGSNNVILGYESGANTVSNSQNVYIGAQAGAGLHAAEQAGNTYLGYRAGYNTLPNLIGSGNVFLGWQAGSGMSLSNKLIIDNNNLNMANSEPPLIYGDFEDNHVQINGTTREDIREVFGIHKELKMDQEVAHLNLKTTTNGFEPGRFRIAYFVDGECQSGISFDKDNVRLLYSNGAFALRFKNADFEVNTPTAIKNTAGSWIGSSDRRLKKNIKQLGSHEMLQKVLLMKGVSYFWDDKRDIVRRPENIQIGFIAQDLQKIWPEKVVEDENGYLMAAYGDYDPVFVEAIKALSAQLDEQKEEIQKLKEELKKLKSTSVVTKN